MFPIRIDHRTDQVVEWRQGNSAGSDQEGHVLHVGIVIAYQHVEHGPPIQIDSGLRCGPAKLEVLSAKN